MSDGFQDGLLGEPRFWVKERAQSIDFEMIVVDSMSFWWARSSPYDALKAVESSFGRFEKGFVDGHFVSCHGNPVRD